MPLHWAVQLWRECFSSESGLPMLVSDQSRTAPVHAADRPHSMQPGFLWVPRNQNTRFRNSLNASHQQCMGPDRI